MSVTVFRPRLGTLQHGKTGFSMPPAKLSREYGLLHLRAGEPEQARERLSAALDIFRRLGASNDAQRTERTLVDLDRA
jgi:hypothetical protein